MFSNVRVKVFSNACFVVVCVSSLFACGSRDGDGVIDSSEVITEQTYVDMHITDDGGENIRVDVQLLQGGPNGNQIRLNDGDELWVSKGPGLAEQSLTGELFAGLQAIADSNVKLDLRLDAIAEYDFFFLRYYIFGDVVYDGVIKQDTEADYYVTYLRNDKTTASGSYVSLPRAFNITAPLQNEIPSRTNDLMVYWEPSGSTNTVSIYFNHNCLNDNTSEFSEFELTDTGSYTIPAATLSLDVSGQCSTTIEISKHGLGRIDQSLGGGGKLAGHRVQRVNVITID